MPRTPRSKAAASKPTLSAAAGARLLRDAGQPARGDVQALLRLAVVKDLKSPEGKAALRAAELSALRTARRLRARAKRIGGAAGAEIEARAKESYFRAVLARELPRVAKSLREFRLPPPPAPPPAPIPAPLVAPGTPTDVQAEAQILSARVQWTPADLTATTFQVLTRVGNSTVATTIVGGAPPHQAIIIGLTPGTTYRFRVKAQNLIGSSAESADSNAIVPLALPAVPGPLDMELPVLSSDPALLIDELAEPARAFIAGAGATANKWRYEHLKVQAIATAREAMRFDSQIATLMSLAVSKLGTAEEILNSTLLAAAADLKDPAQELTKAVQSPDLAELLDPLGDLAAQSLLLPRLLAWLVEKGPLNFWIGLFEAMLCDLAAVVPVFGGATSFGRTGKYLESIFDSDVELKAALEAAAREILARLDGEIEGMVAPLRAAIGEVIAGTKKALADAFEGFDIPLTMTPSEVAGAADVPNADPFADLYERLEAQVDTLAAGVRQRVETALHPLLSGGGGGLFKAIVIAFIVLPLLAFLVISLAGGPFSAALLAAVVLIAAEELVRLLVKWLAGPLLGKVEELKRRLVELVGRLQQFFALQAELVRNQSPVTELKILAGELRQLRDFLPEQFLEESAALLEEARAVILRTATQLGLAAEQALGQENGTAFEIVRADYAGDFAVAGQLPGGRDPEWLAGAALLRDLGRLEAHRTALLDGKEIEFTHRISLLRLAGGAAQFNLLRAAREAVLELTERDLVDRSFPGMYRVQLKDLRVHGLFAAPVAGVFGGIPLVATHLGESRMRVKRSANPTAPPLALPEGLPRLLGAEPGSVELPTAADFARALGGPIPPAPPPPGHDLVPHRPELCLDSLVLAALKTVELQTAAEYQAIFIFALIFALLSGHPDPVGFALEVLTSPFKRACQEQLPEAVGRSAGELSQGVVEESPFVEAMRNLVERTPFGTLMGFTSGLPDLPASAATIAERLRVGLAPEVAPGLTFVALRAWEEGVSAFRRRIARWGDATLEEDPDPQVRALGFASLVRRDPQESAVFNLFPGSALAPGQRADAAAGAFDGPPLGHPSTIQYRPFENRGVGGRLLLRLETIGDEALPQLSDSLTDVVLELTLRGCFDENLARTVRSSRRQTASGLAMAANLIGVPAVPIAQPGSLVRIDAGVSDLRTVRFSLRAHRDRTLQIWNTALQAQPTLAPILGALVAGQSALGRDLPFAPLDILSSFSLELAAAPLANTGAALRSLAQTLRVQPADLGFDPGVLIPGRLELEEAAVVGFGVAVIPMPDGVRGVDDDPTVDPLGLSLTVPPPLSQVFPNFASTAPHPSRLLMTATAAPDNPPRLADLFASGVTTAVRLDFDESVFTPESRLYDVIFSISYRAPLMQMGTRVAALR